MQLYGKTLAKDPLIHVARGCKLVRGSMGGHCCMCDITDENIDHVPRSDTLVLLPPSRVVYSLRSEGER